MSEWEPLPTFEILHLWGAANTYRFSDSDRAKDKWHKWHTACMKLRLEATLLGINTPITPIDAEIFKKVQRQVIEARQNRDIIETLLKTYEAV